MIVIINIIWVVFLLKKLNWDLKEKKNVCVFFFIFSDMIKVYVECKEGIAMKYTKVRNSHKNSLIKYICYNFQLADNTGVSYWCI
jgi:hypothetical protein